MKPIRLSRACAVPFVVSAFWAPSAFAADTDAAASAPTTQESPTPQATQEASERYERGLSLYAGGEYVLALVEFERAYQLAPNYRVLYNIGQVRIQLARYAKAAEALEEYLRQGGSDINAERQRSVKTDLQMLAERTAKLNVVSAEAGADISLDGVVVGTTPLAAPIVVDAGEHTVEVRKAGFFSKSQMITLAGRDEIEVKLDVVKMPESKSPIVVERHGPDLSNKPDRSLAYIGWATTGALAVGAGVVGYMGITKANDLESMRTDYGVTRSQLDDAKSSARTLFMIADITGAAAVVAGGISLYLTISSGSSSEKSPPANDRTHKAAAGEVKFGVTPGGFRMSGTF